MPLKPYWGGPFEQEAERFFGLKEAANTHVYLDGTTLIGFDESGEERHDRGARDYNAYDWDKSFLKRLHDKVNDNSEQTSSLRNAKYSNELRNKALSSLTAGMTKGQHSFYIITHSEGSAYGAGLARVLIAKGWNVHTVIHISADEGDEFSSPAGPLTYQIGYTGRLFGDWVTSNERIRGNVDKWGLVYINNYNGWDEFKAIHGSTRSASIFRRLWDLKTVFVQQVLDSQGHIHWQQAPGSTPNGTQFAQVNGFVIHGNGRTSGTRWGAIRDLMH
ncbi:hypothetical protein [Hymenobacter terrenus]|uniref:hypothetical protein n=1 Tax=Hymenobacter terrenus TaxID=1629124 RepID=UPI0012E09F53|nr:hypothetical protein [Hymenobacter terrenus]